MDIITSKNASHSNRTDLCCFLPRRPHDHQVHLFLRAITFHPDLGFVNALKSKMSKTSKILKSKESPTLPTSTKGNIPRSPILVTSTPYLTCYTYNFICFDSTVLIFLKHSSSDRKQFLLLAQCGY